jgi:hypothetical protein
VTKAKTPWTDALILEVEIYPGELTTRGLDWLIDYVRYLERELHAAHDELEILRKKGD